MIGPIFVWGSKNNWPVWCSHGRSGFTWFRVCGYGLVIKDTRRFPLLFSERMGLRLGIQIGPIWIRLLTPND